MHADRRLTSVEFSTTPRSMASIAALALILLLAIQLRVIFYQGPINYDDIVYAHLAERITEGVAPWKQPLPDAYGAVRVGLYAPTAVAYKLFGVSDATTIAWPLFVALAGIVGAYALARRLAGEAAGLMAAFMLAVLPTAIAASTVLLGDGPIATCSIFTVLFLVRAADAHGRAVLTNAAAALAFFAFGVFCKPPILFMLPFLAVFAIRYFTTAAARVAGVVLLALGVIGAAVYLHLSPPPEVVMGAAASFGRLAATNVDLWQRFVFMVPEFAWIAPLWIAAMVGSMASRRREAIVPLLWLGLTFLYGELGPRSLVTYVPVSWYDSISPGRHMLFIAVAAITVTAIYLASAVERAVMRRIIVLAAVITGIAAYIGTRGADTVTWGVTGIDVAQLPFATMSAVAVIVVVFAGLLSGAIVSARSARLRSVGVTAIMVAMGLASLAYSYRVVNQFRNPQVETIPEAVAFLATQPAKPIVVQNPEYGQRLDYYSKFSMGFKSVMRPFISQARIIVAPATTAPITDHYVLVDDHWLKVYRDLRPFISEPPAPAYLSQIPAHWVKVAEFGKYAGAHLKVYRVSIETARAELSKVHAARIANETPDTLFAELNAAAGAQAYCHAAAMWSHLRTTAPARLEGFDPIAMLTECAAQRADVRGDNVLNNGDFANGETGWGRSPDAKVQISVQNNAGRNEWHGVWQAGSNWVVLDQGQALQPDTAYIYEADIKTTAPVVALYWQTDAGRHFETNKTYPEWTHLTYVFVTPKWDGAPKGANFDPVLMQGAGEVWLANVRVSPYRIPPEDAVR